ncbi:MAG: helix-turn-helix domain-containing protein [Caldilineaceae bacterium]|nr:helix-turn-helix domain-containing protein [Caldilineaceae bacterium]
MEHRTFGKIVAALRREQFDFASGHSWSQQQLAEATGLTARIVGKIERGEQARLDGEILQGLAQAFELTSFERREFFAMASEVTEAGLVRAALGDEDVFTRVWTLLDTLCAPSFLMDPFADIIGVNRALLAFHDLSLAQLKAARTAAGGANNIVLLLAPDAPLRGTLGRGWRPIALANVQQWRAMTLRYRHTPRFRRLFTALCAYPDFQGFWADSHEDGHDDYSRLRSYSYRHGAHGPVAYTVFTNISLSAYGDLYLSTFVPQDRETTVLFQELAGRGGQALSLAPWPGAGLD